jgi:hypothetical protein
LRPIPIFDTNIFGHVQDGSISQKDWRFLLGHRPGRGWPLSVVTALELLAGFQNLHSERFLRQKAQVELAYQLSKGRILEEPRFLLCEEVLRVPFPPERGRLPVDVIADHITVVRYARSMEDILAGRVLVKGLLTRGHGQLGFSGFNPSVLKELLSGPRTEWKQNIENLATENYPRWREHFRETGKRLPEAMRKDVKVRLAKVEREKFGESLLAWLGASTGPEAIAAVAKRLDAVLEFTIYVLREFLTREYMLENHGSDVYDQFQLYYLTLERFMIVSEDSDLTKRTVRSSQANRILPFETFLRSL